MVVSKNTYTLTYIIKYRVFPKSPTNHVIIINILKPSTLLLVWFETNCGMPRVASIDRETSPIIVPYISIFRETKMVVMMNITALKITIIITIISEFYTKGIHCIPSPNSLFMDLLFSLIP